MRAVHELALLDTPREERFDRVVRTAALVCDVPMALLSFVDDSRQWFKATHGTDFSQIPRAMSLCEHTLGTDDPVIVQDLRFDQRFAESSLVVGPPHVRFYAGVAIHATGDHRVGTLFVLDIRPRALDDRQLLALVDLAAIAEHEIMQTELQQTRRRLQQLQRFFDLSRDLLCITNGERFMEVSPSWERALGWRLDELRKMPMSALYATDGPGDPATDHRSSVAGSVVMRMRCADGSSRALEWIMVPDLDDGLMYAVARDVTEKLRIGAALRESEARYRALFATMNVGVVLFDADGAIVACNPFAERLLDAPAAQLLGRKASDPTWGAVQRDGSPLPDGLLPVTRTLLTGEQVRDCVLGVRAQGRGIRWFSVSSSPIAERQTKRIGAVVSLHDISALKLAEDALRESEARSRAILEGAADGIVVVDDRGVIETVNPAARRMFAYAGDVLAGRSASTLTKEAWQQFNGARGRPAEDPSTLGQRLFTGVREDGSTFPVRVAASDVDLGGRHVTVAIFHDMTASTKVDRLKDEFVSTVSHELRTPLTSVRGALGLLAGDVAGPLPASLRGMVDVALRNTERLTRLVDDILDVQKIDSGHVKLRAHPLNLAPLLRQAEEANGAFIAQLGVCVSLQIEPDLWARVDPDRWLQIMTNLMSNAAKFSPPGGVVTVRAFSKGNKVRVEVHDQGPGIPEEFRAQIFERFSQADGSDHRRHGGTGLGLAIAKGLVEQMRGTIDFTSEVGAGTTFIIELPAATRSGLFRTP